MEKEELICKSLDYRDIMYFVKHVNDLAFRFSLIEELGYGLGWNVCNDTSSEGNVIIGQQGEGRVQIEPKDPKFPLVRCAIIKGNH